LFSLVCGGFEIGDWVDKHSESQRRHECPAQRAPESALT
jgi:hypothetical protein